MSGIAERSSASFREPRVALAVSILLLLGLVCFANAAEADLDTPLKLIMQMRLETGKPVKVGNGNVVDDDAILKALLGV